MRIIEIGPKPGKNPPRRFGHVDEPSKHHLPPQWRWFRNAIKAQEKATEADRVSPENFLRLLTARNTILQAKKNPLVIEENDRRAFKP